MIHAAQYHFLIGQRQNKQWIYPEDQKLYQRRNLTYRHKSWITINLPSSSWADDRSADDSLMISWKVKRAKLLKTEKKTQCI